MDKESKFSWKKRGRAFVYAWQGMKALLKYEHNARIHVVVASLAIVAGLFFKISSIEWCLIVICIGLVIAAEALNSAVEALADKITTSYHPLIGRAKDLGATAVTLLAVVAVIVGCFIFIPYIISYIE